MTKPIKSTDLTFMSYEVRPEGRDHYFPFFSLPKFDSGWRKVMLHKNGADGVIKAAGDFYGADCLAPHVGKWVGVVVASSNKPKQVYIVGIPPVPNKHHISECMICGVIN